MSECEYCGHRHDVRELCADRRRMSRRAFFSLSARAIVGVAIAPQIVDAAQALIVAAPHTGTYGGINRATFAFWRNQQTIATTALDPAAWRRLYNECSLGLDIHFKPASYPVGLSALIEGLR